MSDARLKTKIRQLIRLHLSSYGFILSKPRMPERQAPGLRQGLEFQPGTGHLSGQYTVNVFWTYEFVPRDFQAFDGYRRIGELSGLGETWFSREPEHLEEHFARATDLILGVALPYLERHNTIQAIIDAYQSGDLTLSQAFGPDPGWQRFNLGFCYAFLGRSAAALCSLRAVIEEHSSQPWEWVQTRRKRAEDEVARLESA